ncbi:MAG: diguanylate cyclase [candidate division Zixibacteria bacterium]|nr:diguanylate cyclase [candidate division Zixibacteria bacterium]
MDRASVLVVDDEQSARIVLKKILSRDGHEVTTVESGEEGIRSLRQKRPDLILMDIIMPDLDGRQVIARMKEREGENMPPYIYLTIDPSQEREGLEEGADDYIFKGDMNPDKLQIIRLRVKNTLLVRSLLYKDGLTGLYNHGFFQNALDRLFSETSVRSQPLSLVIADIDEFKRLNDSLGHTYGDKVLTGIAQTLQKAVRPADIVARYGGEEIAILLPQTGEHEAVVLAERFRLEIERMAFTGQRGPVTMCFGVATASAGRYVDTASLLKAAEDHMYLAKRLGKNRVCGE